MEKDYQKIISKMGRATTGTFRSTPLGIVIAESKLAPAGPLLDFRQECFAKRLLARPKGHNGPEEILERRGAELTERLRQSSFLKSEERPEGSPRQGRGGEQVGSGPHKPPVALQPAERPKAPEGAPPRTQSPRRPLLPAPVGACGHGGLPVQEDAQVPVGQVLVVRSGPATTSS